MKRGILTFVLALSVMLSLSNNVRVATAYAGEGIDAEAESYKLGSKKKGTTGEYNTNDYYKFKLKKRTNMLMKYSSESSNPFNERVLWMTVYNDRGQTVVASTQFRESYNKINGRGNASVEKALDKGTYYIEVNSWNSNYHYNFIFKKIPTE